MKPIVKFFSDVTDIDNRILRTIITLFKSPAKVVDAYITGQELYIKPLRYALSTASSYIVVQYLYELFFDAAEMGKWWLPIRIDEADARFNTLFEAFFPFQILITAIPVAILVFKLLFFRKTWKEVTVIMLYAIAQFWILMILFIPVLVSADTVDGLIALGCFVIVFVCFRNVMYGNIIIRTGKWLVMTVLVIVWFYEISINLTQYVLTGLLKDYSPAVVTSPVVEPIEVLSLDGQEIAVVQNDPGNRLLGLKSENQGVRVVLLNRDGSAEGEIFLPGIDRIRRALCVTLQPHVYGLLVLTDSLGLSSHAFLLSPEVRMLYKKSYHETLILNGGGLLRGNTLLLAGGRFHDKVIMPFIDVIDLEKEGNKLHSVKERNLFLPNPRQRFDDIYPVDSVKESSEVIVSKYESNKAGTTLTFTNEIISFSVLKINLDSAIMTEWENTVFQKASLYSPAKDETFKIMVDTTHNRILATYGLANDSTLVTQLYNLNGDGQLVWKQQISEDNLTFLSSMYSVKSGIYFSGSVMSGISNPITTGYRQGMFGFISEDGLRVSAVRVGNTKPGDLNYFDKIISGDSISIYNHHLHLGYTGTQSDWKILKFPDNFAKHP